MLKKSQKISGKAISQCFAELCRKESRISLDDLAKSLSRLRPVESTNCFLLHTYSPEVAQKAGCLIVSVPKRCLARAVDRNLVRRLARESWYHSDLQCLAVPVLLRLRCAPAGFFRTKHQKRLFCQQYFSRKTKGEGIVFPEAKKKLKDVLMESSPVSFIQPDIRKKKLRNEIDFIFKKAFLNISYKNSHQK